MKKHFKILAAVLAVMMVIAMTAGCAKDTSTSGENTISWWITNNVSSIVKSYDELPAMAAIEEATGIDIEFFHPAVGSDTEQFNIMCASGVFKDIVTYNWNGYTGGPVQAARDGAILVLDEYLEKEMPNFYSQMQENAELNYLARAYDGSVCVIPSYTTDRITTATFGPAMRKDWLDKLGLEVPTTISDWYKVLTAFKTQDPNGNGLADEIPFVADQTATFERLSRAWDGVESHFYINGDNKVAYGFIQPDFKDFLTEMNKWYKEGLLDNEYAATNESVRNQKMVSGVGGSFIGYAGSGMSKFVLGGRETNPDFDMIGVQWPTHKGEGPFCGYSYQASIGTAGKGMAISAKVADPAKVLNFIDYLFGDEGTAFINWGIEGDTYTVDADGNKTFTDKILKNPDGKTPVEAISEYAMTQYGMARSDADAYMQVNQAIPQQQVAMELWNQADVSRIFSGILVTPEEQDELTKVLDDVLTYRSEWMNKFVMGIEPLEKFDEVANNIKKLGIEKATAIYQTAYERKLATK